MIGGMSGKAKTRGKLGKSGTEPLAEVVRRWPRERGLAVVCGGGPAWGRTIVAEPSGSVWIPPDRAWMPADTRAMLKRWKKGRSRRAGGWVVSLSYELGERIEPAVRRRRPAKGGWPLIEFKRCENVFVFDHGRGGWDRPIEFLEDRPRRSRSAASYSIGKLRSDMGRKKYEAAVARAIEYIRAGDVYQVNLAHRMRGRFSGSARAAFADMVESARPWHGAYVEQVLSEGFLRVSPETETGALLSMSPELFLRVEGRRVMTRPMKGTRPGAVDPSELRESGKDRAELNMIIDLMRNDLGRVCRFGTVRVDEARAIERHGGGERRRVGSGRASGGTGGAGVWQGVGTVVGELRKGLDVVDLLGAAFPAGSVTGAPKIRAMQIIDELEVCERGPYCGSIGWIGDDGRACLNVAIRTACVRGGRADGARGEFEDGEISFSVGAGIVAESEPRKEWEETLVKAGVMERLGRRG